MTKMYLQSTIFPYKIQFEVLKHITHSSVKKWVRLFLPLLQIHLKKSQQTLIEIAYSTKMELVF